ncbi:hypothetical protein [Hylemonella gracilis]|uniref:Uncharacterized protein n=1 Tax=Hylemonella gracilis ATCC 19624 TaxID=887062 RepID=F3KX33_9BURK|nr:hypothetical protein [Hylemonella gracilis]EGI75662.1 hypothetical protein HGR_15109 [Hylemonella gracilis ATCC 19624]
MEEMTRERGEKNKEQRELASARVGAVCGQEDPTSCAGPMDCMNGQFDKLENTLAAVVHGRPA